MSADLYRPCPCGSGKKIKFCCSRPIAADLERVERMIDGDQLLAARERLEGLRAKHPEIAAIRMLEAEISADQEEFDQALTRLDEIQRIAPQNPTVHLFRAALLSSTVMQRVESQEGANLTELAATIQQELLTGFELWPTGEPLIVNSVGYAIQAANVLGALGRKPLALGLMLILSAAAGELPDLASMVQQQLASSRTPFLIKAVSTLEPAPTNVYWQREFQQAYDLTTHMRWEKALGILHEMARRILDEPAILWNIAVLTTWLNRIPEAATAWQNVAALRQLPRWKRQLAEAMAMSIDEKTSDAVSTVEVVRARLELTDASVAMERALSCANLVQAPTPMEEDGPPPRGLFFFSLRSWPDNAPPDQTPIDQIPMLDGQLAIYGRETDRAARAEFTSIRTEAFDAKLAKLREILGDSVVADGESEEVVGNIPRLQADLDMQVLPHRDLPVMTMFRFRRQLINQFAYQQLADYPYLAELQGTTLRQVAADPKRKLMTEALLMNYETFLGNVNPDFDPTVVRQQIGVALPELMPAEEALAILPRDSAAIYWLPWVDVAQATPLQLSSLYAIAGHYGLRWAQRRIGQEILGRADWPESAGDQPVLPQLAVVTDLIRRTDSPLELVELSVKGQELALAAGKLPVPWMLTEFQAYFRVGDAVNCQRIYERLESRYMHQPEAAKMIYQTLVQIGAIQPQVSPRDAAALQAVPASASSASGLWTPDGPQPAAAPAAESPSKLWVPD
ncbi:MAG: tetratricopeptide repeat protein [Pirellulales bacterium]